MTKRKRSTTPAPTPKWTAAAHLQLVATKKGRVLSINVDPQSLAVVAVEAPSPLWGESAEQHVGAILEDHAHKVLSLGATSLAHALAMGEAYARIWLDGSSDDARCDCGEIGGCLMTELAATATPLTRDATAQMFLPSYVAVFGEEPDRNRAELLLALMWLENANGASIIRCNWGNLSTRARADIDYWRPPWFDVEKIDAMEDGPKKTRLLALHEKMLSNAAPEAFRAFATQDAGARAWLSLLQTPSMRPILDAASSGDAVAFAHAIFSTRYCPDTECRDAGPSYGNLRDQIHAAGYFAGLKKKPALPVAVPPVGLALSFWCWGLLLRRRTSGVSHADGARLGLTGEP